MVNLPCLVRFYVVALSHYRHSAAVKGAARIMSWQVRLGEINVPVKVDELKLAGMFFNMFLGHTLYYTQLFAFSCVRR